MQTMQIALVICLMILMLSFTLLLIIPIINLAITLGSTLAEYYDKKLIYYLYKTEHKRKKP